MLIARRVTLLPFLIAAFLLPSITTAQTALDLGNAEVIVNSSTSPSFVGMASTDAEGRFVIKDVPKGGITIVIRRHSEIVARGAAIFDGGVLTEAGVRPYLVGPSVDHLKSGTGR